MTDAYKLSPECPSWIKFRTDLVPNGPSVPYRDEPLHEWPEGEAPLYDTVHEPPTTPRQLHVAYTSTDDATGRLVRRSRLLEELPAHCTVGALKALLHELLGTSPRQPLDVQYWGRSLDDESRLLKEYALKEHSEITVAVKPRLKAGGVVPGIASRPLAARVRLAAAKLEAPLAVELGDRGAATTVAELRQAAYDSLRAHPDVADVQADNVRVLFEGAVLAPDEAPLSGFALVEDEKLFVDWAPPEVGGGGGGGAKKEKKEGGKKKK